MLAMGPCGGDTPGLGLEAARWTPTGKRQPANQRGCFFCHRERKEEGKRKKPLGQLLASGTGRHLA